MKRNLYLNTIPVEEAGDLYMRSLGDAAEPHTEKIRVTDALGHLSGGSLEEITAADASAREETLREAARIAGKRG